MRTCLQLFGVFLFIIFTFPMIYGQAYGYEFTKPRKKRIKIKFDKKSNLIIVPVRLNGKYDLNFIVDSGVRHLLITKRRYTDSLGIKYGKEFQIYGADKESSVTAMIANNLQLELPGLMGKRKTALVLKEDYFDFDKTIGVRIDGIIGMDLFMRFTVKIDYVKEIMTLYEPDKFKVPKSYKPYNLETHKDKLYLKTIAMSKRGYAKETKLLLDTGASLYMLLDLKDGHHPLLPRRVIKGNVSQVLGGNMTTYVGRIGFLGLIPYRFQDVIVNFQAPIILEEQLKDTFDREGLIGGGLLSRFHVIIDAFNEKIYLKKNNRYGQPFTRDKSGIVFEEESEDSKRIKVIKVIPESPAYYAGVQRGDIIIKCNGKRGKNLTINALVYLLQHEQNLRIKMTLLRDGQIIKRVFRLQDMI